MFHDDKKAVPKQAKHEQQVHRVITYNSFFPMDVVEEERKMDDADTNSNKAESGTPPNTPTTPHRELQSAPQLPDIGSEEYRSMWHYRNRVRRVEEADTDISCNCFSFCLPEKKTTPKPEKKSTPKLA